MGFTMTLALTCAMDFRYLHPLLFLHPTTTCAAPLTLPLKYSYDLSPPFIFKYFFPKLWILPMRESTHYVTPNARNEVAAQYSCGGLK